MLRGVASFGVALTAGTLTRLATDLTSCFVAGLVTVLADTTNAAELDTIASLFGALLLGVKVFNGLVFVPRPGKLEDLFKAFPG